MILVAGLTPAWQQIYCFRHFQNGEVNRAELAMACASGKVLNVGCALFHLGIDSRTLSPVGGMTGQLIQSEFKQMGVPVRWIPCASAIRTCTTILDETTGSTTELVENSYPISAQELDAFSSAFDEEARRARVVVITGSLPRGTPNDYLRQLMDGKQAKFILDVRGPELEQILPLNPYVVKPNREELAKTVGRALDCDDDLIGAMRILRERGAQWVVVSQGSAALFALGPDGLLQLKPPEVTVRNPIGCGDCLAAGIAAGVHRQEPMLAALELGIRAAAENARALLPARNLTRIA